MERQSDDIGRNNPGGQERGDEVGSPGQKRPQNPSQGQGPGQGQGQGQNEPRNVDIDESESERQSKR